MIDVRVLLAVIGSVITLTIFVLGVTYKAGHTSARVDELERWRGSMRNDMHEVSDKLQTVSNQITHLTTLVEERTERRKEVRTDE